MFVRTAASTIWQIFFLSVITRSGFAVCMVEVVKVPENFAFFPLLFSKLICALWLAFSMDRTNGLFLFENEERWKKIKDISEMLFSLHEKKKEYVTENKKWRIEEIAKWKILSILNIFKLFTKFSFSTIPQVGGTQWESISFLMI